MLVIFRLAGFGIFMVTPVWAEVEVSLYGGAIYPMDSQVQGQEPGGSTFDFSASWGGPGLQLPSQYGLRLTWWQTPGTGWGLDFDHSNIQADDATLSDNGLGVLGFSGGLNLFTVNAYHRWPKTGVLTPYVGAGLGVMVPRVDYQSSTQSHSAVHLSGPAVQWIAGASYPISARLSVFGEYKGSYSVNHVDLQNGGGLSTNILSNGINLGLSLGF